MKRCTLPFIILLIFSKIAYTQGFDTIFDNFLDNRHHWLIDTTMLYESKIDQEAYFIKNKSELQQTAFVSSILINPNNNYTIEAKFTQLSGSKKNGFGIIWGKYFESDYLAFMINSKRKYFIEGKSNNKYFKIKNWTNAKRKIEKMGIPNILTIQKTRKRTKYIVNGEIIHRSKNHKFIGTEVGAIINYASYVKIDYFKITTKKDTINLIANPINEKILENIGTEVNSQYSEKGPIISSDGKTMYITRTHPDNINGLKSDDIWYTTLDENGEWKKLERAEKPLNNEGNNFVISVTPDGNALLLGNTYKRNGHPDKPGVSIARKREGKWRVPKGQIIKDYENIDNYGSFFLSADGNKLIICAENDNSYGDLDLFISFQNKWDKWSKPQNMGATINTFAADFSPFLAADGKTLYFASFGHPGYGSSDIFVSNRLDDSWTNWSRPQNMGPEINSYNWDADYCVSAIGDYAYMVSTKSDISYGAEDIFKIKTNIIDKPDPVFLVVGKTFNKKTNEPINADVFYENLNNSNETGIAYSTIEDGYKIVLPQGAKYGFSASADNFFAVSKNVNLNNLKAFEEQGVNLFLIPFEKGQTFRLNNIFFDFDKVTLKPESFPELSRLVELLNETPKLQIEIGGHTDNKGSDQYNRKLSQDRATSVMNYLITHQIKATRITAKGYGESHPITTNETDEGRQLNRRVEFIITND